MQTQTMRRLFALGGIVAPILFTIVVVASSLLRPGYNQTYNFISDLGVGPFAIIQNANFVVFGLLVIGLAFGLLISLPSPRRTASKAGIWLVIVFGLGVFFAGVFPEDYLGGGLHTLASSTAFLAIIVAQLLISRGSRSEDGGVWGGYRAYSLASGILSFVLLVAFRVTLGGDYQGAAQRAFLAVPWTWIEVTGLKLYSLTRRAPTQER